jgi:hypothetical protein
VGFKTRSTCGNQLHVWESTEKTLLQYGHMMQ